MPERLAHALLSPFGWEKRFTDLERIGSGAMGQVWRAREVSTGLSVALKVLDPMKLGDEQTLARLEIEGETLTRLREAGAHEHIVPILDFKITSEHACLVMAFIPGLNLKTWCSTHQLNLSDRVQLIAQVARASGWFHRLGIVHRDLKPANILVDARTHQPVIVDFSIAKQESGLALTLTHEALGTAPYMAPEQFDRRRGEVTPATDVYALGATLYELLTQVHPHPGDFPAIMQRHAEERRPARPSALNPEVPQDLECILLKALSPRQADRYANGSSLAADLERFLAGLPVHARPISRLTHLGRQVCRKPALCSAIAACFLIAAFAGWNLWCQQQQEEVYRLEAEMATALQQSLWDRRTLEWTNGILANLAQHQEKRAIQLRQQLHDDVVHDIETSLQLSLLRDKDFEWMQAAVAWLKENSHVSQAERLGILIAQRQGRWLTQAELQSPFTDFQGLFPHSPTRVEGDLLFPLQGDPKGQNPVVLVTESLSLPMEAACTFVAKRDSFQRISMDVSCDDSRLDVVLCKAETTPRAVLASLGANRPEPREYVMFLARNKSFHSALRIPDAKLLDQPFTLMLRIERDRAEASVNGRWSLPLSSVFSLGTARAANKWQMVWPEGVGLQHLSLRLRRTDAVSPLEEADLAAAQGKWSTAIRLYENLQGDPSYGDEADFKIAECHGAQGNEAAALALWERLSLGPRSIWGDSSLLRLWVHEAMQPGGLPRATTYLQKLTVPLPSSLYQQLRSRDIQNLRHLYAAAGMCFTLPRVDPSFIVSAVHAYQLIRMPPIQIANRFALAHHAAGMDQRAHELFHQGIQNPTILARSPDNLLALTSCLDQWCRLVPSEQHRGLNSRLEDCHLDLPQQPTVQAIWHLEQARRAARAGDHAGALKHCLETQPLSAVDDRVRTNALLVEGMIHRKLGDEASARNAWRQGLDIARTVTLQSPLFLCDCTLLHSLVQNWELEAANHVLTPLVARHLRGNERAKVQTAFRQSFLTSTSWLTSMNAVLSNERGRSLAEEYVFCQDRPHSLVLRFYRLLLEKHFLRTAFSTAKPRERERVQIVIDQLVNEMALNPGGRWEDLMALLRAWDSPEEASALLASAHAYPAMLVRNLQWLLQQRHSGS